MRKMLVPLDGSELAERVLPILLRLAESEDTVLLLTVEEFLPPPKDPQHPGVFHTGRMERLQRYCKALEGAGVRSEAAVRYGDPAETVLACAKETGADSVLISTHGRTGLDRVLYGSVAHKVLLRFPGEVILVRPPKASLKSAA
jgi:nucleotide-binding universal stress UspA family protein